jgi:hypothetical protein
MAKVPWTITARMKSKDEREMFAPITSMQTQTIQTKPVSQQAMAPASQPPFNDRFESISTSPYHPNTGPTATTSS